MVTVSGEWSCFSSRQIEYNRIPGSNASDIVFTMARILMCSLCGIDVLSQIPPMQPGLSNAPQHHKWIVQSCHRIYCMWFQHHFSSGRLVIQTGKNIFFSENGPTLEQDTSSFFNHILALVIVRLGVANQAPKNVWLWHLEELWFSARLMTRRPLWLHRRARCATTLLS